MRAIVAAAMFVSMASAQTPDWFAGVHADVVGFAYPPLARATRTTGLVRFRVDENTGAITVVSGHPLLVPAVKANMAKWKIATPLDAPIFVEWQFSVTSPTIATVDVPKEDPCERFFRRLFRVRTYDEVEECHSSPATDIHLWAIGDHTVTIQVSAQSACVVTIHDPAPIIE